MRRLAIYHFILHYHLERNHQGLDNRLIVPIGAVGEKMGSVQRRERLGGMLSYYYETPPDGMQNDPVTCKIEFLDTTRSGRQAFSNRGIHCHQAAVRVGGEFWPKFTIRYSRGQEF